MIEHHRARRLALQGLCCLDVQGEAVMDLVEAFIRDSHEEPPTLDEARRMLRGAHAARSEADPLLAGESRHWNVARMALVDRNILRLAVWELLTGRTPGKVVIDEALRLAKEFASGESSRFVNGVLDAAAKRISRDAGNTGDNAEVQKQQPTTGGQANAPASQDPPSA